MIPIRSLSLCLALPLLATTQGCCSVARLFCGPEQSRWVPLAYDTPQATLGTFLEALRRDNPDQVLRCLSESYKEQHGLNSAAIQVAWDQLRKEIPRLYMAGYLEVPAEPSHRSDRMCSYNLDVDGSSLQIDLVRQSYVQVVYQLQDGTVVDGGHSLPRDAWTGAASIEAKGFDPDSNPQSAVDLLPIVFAHPRYRELTTDQLQSVAIGREWKISNLIVR